MFICETLKQIRMLYDEHTKGNAIHITWYHTDALTDTTAMA
jgi:hypothetical protein